MLYICQLAAIFLSDPCLPDNPCKNGGTCTNNGGEPCCKCPEGFEGPKCDIPS